MADHISREIDVYGSPGEVMASLWKAALTLGMKPGDADPVANTLQLFSPGNDFGVWLKGSARKASADSSTLVVEAARAVTGPDGNQFLSVDTAKQITTVEALLSALESELSTSPFAPQVTQTTAHHQNHSSPNQPPCYPNRVEPAKAINAENALGRIPLLGRRKFAEQLQEENQRLRAELSRIGGLSNAQLSHDRDCLAAEVHQLSAKLNDLQRKVAKTTDEEILQEVGVYDYTHPLDSAVGYKAQLTEIKQQIKAASRAGGTAVSAVTSWTVNGSPSEGKRMVRETSKLMLRAYNTEADTLVRGLKPYKLEAAADRLDKSRSTIAKLGKTMSIEISFDYHRLRIKELELTADYLARQAEEKEEEREERARLREERKAQQELERERERLEKERSHYETVLAHLRANGDESAIGSMEVKLANLVRAIEDVDYRAANIRAGYVYVISNIGSFGPRIVKIGMTRRLEPRDRVKELGDASVPFNFDVHALFFSDDAVGIESELHKHFADRRVNLVNQRREFFYITPTEAGEALDKLTGDILEFSETPEAVEFHQSEPERAVKYSQEISGISR